MRQAAAAAPAGAMIMVECYASRSGIAAHKEPLVQRRAEPAVAFLQAQRPDLWVGMNYVGVGHAHDGRVDVAGGG